MTRGHYSGCKAIFSETDGMTFNELQAHHGHIEQEYLARMQQQEHTGAQPALPEVNTQPLKRLNR